MINVTLVGRLTADPETRTISSGKSVTSFTVACDDLRKKDVTHFLRVSCWGSNSDFIQNYGGKGRLVAVNGSLHSNKKEDKTYWEVTADQVKLLDRPKDAGQSKPSNTSDDLYDPYGEE